jgi:hypothetical protein
MDYEVANRAVSGMRHLDKVASQVVDGQEEHSLREERVLHCWMDRQFLQYILLCAVPE